MNIIIKFYDNKIIAKCGEIQCDPKIFYPITVTDWVKYLNATA